mmetsp:Transcript_73159/g.195101  ORF Transcript_73159/g.195101 Transcript_73159/m.195101 type:complete len:425 (+) Transcript_73159:75-1349(+)
MPGVAHSLVDGAVSYGISTLEWTKSKEGTLRWVVEKVERPAKFTLETQVGKTAIKVGDSCLNIADRTIDSAINNKVYKSCEALVRNTYSNRVRPAVVNTTTMVTTPISNAYMGVLTLMDRQVEFWLPASAEDTKTGQMSLVSIASKASKRTGRRIYIVKKWTITQVSAVSDSVVRSVKLLHPSNVHKQIREICWLALVNTDNFVDRYLPDAEDTEAAKGPTTLVAKVVRRAVKKGKGAIVATAIAVKKSPETFKAAGKYAVSTIRAAPARLRSTASAVISYDYRGAATARITSLATFADELLKRHKLTLAARNFAVNRLGSLVRRLLRLEVERPIATPLVTAPVPAPAARRPEDAPAASAEAKPAVVPKVPIAEMQAAAAVTAAPLPSPVDKPAEAAKAGKKKQQDKADGAPLDAPRLSAHSSA